jgi:DNA primase
MATPEDRILLLLSIKGEGKMIGFGHIAEKVIRDEEGEIGEAEIRDIIAGLISKKLISELDGKYSITKGGMERITNRVKLIGDELNLSYRMVLKARNYYPIVAEAIMPFLKDRAVSVIKIFSDGKDPVHKVRPLFVRYARYKPKPVFIQIKRDEELLRYVDAHAIDFIPYVHKFGASQPDWFVLDLDAGPAFKDCPIGFELVKIVAGKVVEVLEDYEIAPSIKFSGSRGIQMWARLDNAKLPSGDLFALYRKLATFVQGKVEKKIQQLPSNTLEEFYKVTQKGKAITTSTVAKKRERADQILVDWSSMKPNGDVRAPFSMHYKTGLVSCPIQRERLLEFDLAEAEPENVAKNCEKLSDAFKLEISDPSQLFHLL